MFEYLFFCFIEICYGCYFGNVSLAKEILISTGPPKKRMKLKAKKIKSSSQQKLYSNDSHSPLLCSPLFAKKKRLVELECKP